MQKHNARLTPLTMDGNDTLIGLGGSDTLVGGDGNDTLDGGRMRWRTSAKNISKKTAANDEITHAWRAAA